MLIYIDLTSKIGKANGKRRRIHWILWKMFCCYLDVMDCFFQTLNFSDLRKNRHSLQYFGKQESSVSLVSSKNTFTSFLLSLIMFHILLQLINSWLWWGLSMHRHFALQIHQHSSLAEMDLRQSGSCCWDDTTVWLEKGIAFFKSQQKEQSEQCPYIYS